MDHADNQDIASLEQRLRQADDKALAQLFRLHRFKLERMAHFRMDPRLTQRLSVDDLLQEAWLDARKRISRFQADGFTSSLVWLRLVLQQTLADAHRKHLGARQRDLRRERSLAAPWQDTSASLALHLLGLHSSPSRAVQREEQLDLLQQAIDGMDPMDQEILALRYFEELSNTECAEALQITQKNASIRHVRALRRLRAIMDSLLITDFSLG